MKIIDKPLILDGPFKEWGYKFIEYKRSLGFQYKNGPDKVIRNMDNFFKKYNLKEIKLTKEMVDDFIQKRKNESNNTIYKRQHIIKEFAIFLKNNGFNDVYIFNEKYIDGRTNFIPYIYTHEEINKIFNFMDNLNYCPRSKNQHLVYPVLFRLIYSCGLRINEALSLKIKDVNDGIISILNSKGNVSRYIPLSNSMNEILNNYILTMKIKDNDYLFPLYNGEKYSLDISKRFKRIIIKLGINNKARIHDLRHTFAVHTLEKMVNEKQDVYCTLPILSKYMGHSKVTSTEHYLRLVESNYKNIIDNSILNDMTFRGKNE